MNGRPVSAPGASPSSALTPTQQRMVWGDNALSAPSTPDKRMPVIDRTKVDPQLRAAAEGMEAMFLDYLMKVMRESVPKNDMDLESPATDIYRGMLDTETATRAAKTGRGVGLADQIIAYLLPERYNLGQGPGMAPAAGYGMPPRNSRVPLKEPAVQGGSRENHE